MNDMFDDQAVIARLRSALDEVAASEPQAAPSPGRRPTIAWLVVAAASVALVGGAAWALSQRQTASTASNSPTTDPPTPTTVGQAPTTVAAVSAPWFALASPDLVPGVVTRTAPASGSDGPLYESWRIQGDGLDGFLFASLYANRPGWQPDAEPGAVQQLSDVADGNAWLVFPPSTTDEFVAPGLYWSRSTGELWVFEQQGLYSAVSSNSWLDLVLAAQPGSGLPVVVPDPRATVLAVGTTASDAFVQEYTSTSAGRAKVIVCNGGDVFAALIGATSVEPVTVAGDPGWIAMLPNGAVSVVWDAGGGWWAQLGLSPELADRATGIIAAITAAGDAVTATSPT